MGLASINSLELNMDQRNFDFDDENLLAETTTGVNVWAESLVGDDAYILMVTHELHPLHLSQPYRLELASETLKAISELGAVQEGSFTGAINQGYVLNYETQILRGEITLCPGSDIREVVNHVAEALHDIVPGVVGFDNGAQLN